MSATNKQMFDAVKNAMPKADAELLEGVDLPEVMQVFADYPNVKNSFINTLQNKIAKSMIYSKEYKNPLKNLKKGYVEMGLGIEELFVQMAEEKNFGENWETGGTTEGDLIKALKPKVQALYITINHDKKYKTTVFDKQLRKAFVSEGGLARLVQSIVSSIQNKQELTEYQYTRDTLVNLVSSAKQKQLDADHKTESDVQIPSGTSGIIKQTPMAVQVHDAMSMLTAIREYTGKLGFVSNKYNLAKVDTFSKPEDLILITDPKNKANIDVNALAMLFNVPLAEVPTRIMQVDVLPTSIFSPSSSDTTITSGEVKPVSGNTVGTVNKEVVGILIDKDLLQIWDTYRQTGTFYNSESFYTNHFANNEGIFATCLFANMVVFYK